MNSFKTKKNKKTMKKSTKGKSTNSQKEEIMDSKDALNVQGSAVSNYSPYLNQLHLLFEKSLLEDAEMDEAHHLSEFLLQNPEFYPLESTSETKPKEKQKK